MLIIYRNSPGSIKVVAPLDSIRRTLKALRLAGKLMVFLWVIQSSPAQLINNLQFLPNRIPVGDPLVAAADGKEGPKSIATADFNGDNHPDLAVSNLDGTVTVLLRQGDRFSAPRHLNTGASELRSILVSDLNGDAQPDIGVTSPLDGQVILFFNTGGGNFGQKKTLTGMKGVRCLASGDFDGDGIMDLAAAGPRIGVRHFRGTGAGFFSVMGELRQLSPAHVDLASPRPVYAMRTIRARDGTRDDLLVTHADIPVLWILSTAPVRPAEEPPVNLATTLFPAWINRPSPVLLHEVQVINARTLQDSDGAAGPWAELFNKSNSPVNLTGWQLKLQTATWTFPDVTIQPGSFLIVFLSGKDRTGPELHTSFILKQSTDAIHLLQPDGTVAGTIDLPANKVPDVSRGLAPDTNETKWFDTPSPGLLNNAGTGSIEESSLEEATTLTIEPRNPSAGQSVTVSVRTPPNPAGAAYVRNVWFSTAPGLTEIHHLMHRISSGFYQGVVPASDFKGTTPHRVLAGFREVHPTDGTVNDYTVELHQGLDTPGTVAAIPSLPGCIQLVASVPTPKVKAFDIGNIVSPNGNPDLIFADEEGSRLRVLRSGPGVRRFDPMSAVDTKLAAPPRDVKLADTDSDGRLDATAVLERLDLAVTCRNVAGSLIASGQIATGKSPRELVMADFTGDGRPDAAVINRVSNDISILPASQPLQGLVSSDQIYPVDGDVGAIQVRDFNADGRADVLQLHRASAEISIRFAKPDGLLGPPAFWSLGAYGPGAVGIDDFNNDGRPDVVSANLGRENAGSLTILLGNGLGDFTTSQVIDAGAALFAVSTADFNNDDNTDIVAGLWDCRLMFFFGSGNGQFTKAYKAPVPFINESRVMVTNDFDQDGDTDIAGFGIEGDLATLQNNGAAEGSWVLTKFPKAPKDFGAERLVVTHVNADSDPDLIIGGGDGIIVFEGGSGMSFKKTGLFTTVASTGFAISDLLAGDLNGDGRRDWVASCVSAACIDVLSQTTDNGPFVVTHQFNVPSARYLTTGDIDGDGKPDLAGTGDSLWTVLSSRAPQIAAPGSTDTNRARVSGVLINEVLARNTGISVPTDNARKTDFIELYNNTGSAVNLSGWKLRVQGSQEGTPFDETWTAPSISVDPHARFVITCAPASDPPVASEIHTGFTLPAEGGIVTLTSENASQYDTVKYPKAQENVSWSRFLDGHPSFRANSSPSPGTSNQTNSRVPPEFKLIPPPPAALVANQPLEFRARGSDDLAIVSMSLIWKRLDFPDSTPKRASLWDNGENNDGAAGDGIFAGRLQSIPGLGLPPGAAIQFYLEAVDISDQVTRLPEGAYLTEPGETPVAWTLSISQPPALKIVEVCTNNLSLLRDERGDRPDYIKVRNTGSTPVDLGNIQIARSAIADSNLTFAFPAGQMLQSGEEVTVFADADPSEGPAHAPFTLDSSGDDLSLLAVTSSSARQWIQALSLPVMGTDSRLVLLTGSSFYGLMEAGTNPENWAGRAYDESGSAFAAIHFLARRGTSYPIEGDAAGAPVAWSPLQTISGDGALHTIVRPIQEMAALRIVSTSAPPSIQVQAVGTDATQAGIYGIVNGATAVTLYYGRSIGGLNPTAWEHSMSSNGGIFEFIPTNLASSTRYFYALKADTVSGPLWRHNGESFTTKGANYPQLNLSLTHLDVTSATFEITASIPFPVAQVFLLAGPADSPLSDTSPPWMFRVPAQPAGNGRWIASLSNLPRESQFYARAFFSNVGPPSATRLRFRTQGPAENLIQNLRLSEIMYHPAWPTAKEAAAGFEEDDFEYIELHNASSDNMDLSGLWFSGIAFDFPSSGAPVLPPGGYAVIASNPHAFAMRYGAHIPLAGWTLHPFRNSRLANSGEAIALRASDGTVLFNVSYIDGGIADGAGASLALQASGALHEELPVDYGAHSNWGGSPGGPAAVPAVANYDQWKVQQFVFPQDPAANQNSDPDFDGLSNRLEYESGTNPTAPNGDLLEMRTDADGIKITFPVKSNFSSQTAFNSHALMITSDPRHGPWLDLGYCNFGNYSASHYNSYLSERVISPDRKSMKLTIHIPFGGNYSIPPGRQFFRMEFR